MLDTPRSPRHVASCSRFCVKKRRGWLDRRGVGERAPQRRTLRRLPSRADASAVFEGSTIEAVASRCGAGGRAGSPAAFYSIGRGAPSPASHGSRTLRSTISSFTVTIESDVGSTRTVGRAIGPTTPTSAAEPKWMRTRPGGWPHTLSTRATRSRSRAVGRFAGPTPMTRRQRRASCSGRAGENPSSSSGESATARCGSSNASRERRLESAQSIPQR